MSACRYTLVGRESIISSLRLDGAAAQRALAAIRAEPVGGGPDEPQNCAPDVSYGDEVVVLLAGGGEVVVSVRKPQSDDTLRLPEICTAALREAKG